MRALPDSLYLFVVLSDLSIELSLWTHWERSNININFILFYFYLFRIRVYVCTVHWVSISNRFGHISRDWRIFRENILFTLALRKRSSVDLPEISQKILHSCARNFKEKFKSLSMTRCLSQVFLTDDLD